jgi:hypothetical protein
MKNTDDIDGLDDPRGLERSESEECTKRFLLAHRMWVEELVFRHKNKYVIEFADKHPHQYADLKYLKALKVALDEIEILKSKL